jgi:hypothetical protein
MNAMAARADENKQVGLARGVDPVRQQAGGCFRQDALEPKLRARKGYKELAKFFGSELIEVHLA